MRAKANTMWLVKKQTILISFLTECLGDPPHPLFDGLNPLTNKINEHVLP